MAAVETVIAIIGKILTIIAAAVTALWVYTKYILEQGFLPPIEFYLTGEKVGQLDGKAIINVKVHLKNCGSTTLVARNIRLDVRYAKSDSNLIMKDKASGRTNFPKSVLKIHGVDPFELMPDKIKKDEEKMADWRRRNQRGFLVLPQDTFVQAGVSQAYSFVTHVEKDARAVLLWSSFEYAQKPSKWQRRIFQVSRYLGLIQYSLAHAEVPHTTEAVFWVDEEKKVEHQQTKEDKSAN